MEEQAKKIEEINNSNLENETENEKEKKLREKKKSVSDSPTQIDINHKLGGKSFVEPNLNEIKTYFLENNFPEQEAQKFYNYFSSVGWLVGGKTPMVNWQAAAQNWIINAPKFISNAEQPNKAKHLNTTTDKDYAEPL